MSELDANGDPIPCMECGGVSPTWFVDSDRWNMACPDDDRALVLCPGCFVARHEAATGLQTVWELRPAAPFRWRS